MLNSYRFRLRARILRVPRATLVRCFFWLALLTVFGATFNLTVWLQIILAVFFVVATIRGADTSTVVILGLATVGLSGLVFVGIPQLFSVFGFGTVLELWASLPSRITLLIITIFCAVIVLWLSQQRSNYTTIRDELVGWSLALGMTVYGYRHFANRSDLLIQLLPAEDNQAWVRIANALGPGGTLGSDTGFTFQQGYTVPLLLRDGIGGGSGLDGGSSVFALYWMLMILSPFVVGAIFAGIPHRTNFSHLIQILASVFLIGGLQQYFSNGHLAAAGATIAMIGGCAIFRFTDTAANRRRLIPLIFGVAVLPGLTWYPAAGYTLVLLCVVIAWCRASKMISRAQVVVLVVGCLCSATLFVYLMTGLSPTSIQSGISSVQGLLSLAGGSPVLSISLLATITIIALFTVVLKSNLPVLRISEFIALVPIIQALAVLVIVYLIQSSPSSYGVQKLEFSLYLSIIVASLFIIAHLSLERRQEVLIFATIGLLMFTLSGEIGGAVSRAWPAYPAAPAWLPPLEAAVAKQRLVGATPVPITCLSGDPYTSYICSRWSEGLVGIDSYSDQRYLTAAYLLAGPDESTLRVKELIQRGANERLDALVIDSGGLVQPWQLGVMSSWRTTYVTTGDGTVQAGATDVQRVKWLAVKDARWAQPAQDLVDALLAKPPDQGVSEIICYGSDPAESSACSFFATEQLGKQSSTLPDGLVTEAEQTVLDAKAAGTLDDVVILALDLPLKKDLLPYQKVLFSSVEAIYQVTPAGGLRRVPDSSW